MARQRIDVTGGVGGAPDRVSRRKALTRARLLEAAHALIADSGVEGLRIADITERADVGFGSFYNHFADKEEIVNTVLKEVVAAHGAAVQALTPASADPAEAVALAHRHFVRLAESSPTIAWLMVRLDTDHHILAAAVGGEAAKDLIAGLKAQRFVVPDLSVALHASGGALITVMQAVLEGTASPNADVAQAQLVLQMFGVSPRDAEQIATRPFPQA